MSPCGPAMNLSRVQPHLRPRDGCANSNTSGDKECETSGERWMDVELLLMDFFFFLRPLYQTFLYFRTCISNSLQVRWFLALQNKSTCLADEILS